MTSPVDKLLDDAVSAARDHANDDVNDGAATRLRLRESLANHGAARRKRFTLIAGVIASLFGSTAFAYWAGWRPPWSEPEAVVEQRTDEGSESVSMRLPEQRGSSRTKPETPGTIETTTTIEQVPHALAIPDAGLVAAVAPTPAPPSPPPAPPNAAPALAAPPPASPAPPAPQVGTVPRPRVAKPAPIDTERTPVASRRAVPGETKSPPVVSKHAVPGETKPEPTAATPAAPVEAKPAPTETKPAPVAPVTKPTPVGTKPAPVEAKPTVDAVTVERAPKPQPSAEIAAYRHAHQLHFRGNDPKAALAAWDAYLAKYPNGALAPEARYDRALVLVKLARWSEARAALAPFANAKVGSYRQKEAAEILAAIRDR